jgi:hypothetical protein
MHVFLVRRQKPELFAARLLGQSDYDAIIKLVSDRVDNDCDPVITGLRVSVLVRAIEEPHKVAG